MTEDEARRAAGAAPKGKRPWFFEDEQAERVLAVTLAVAQELAVTRERLDTVERLLEAGVPVTRAAIDAYRPDDAVAAERQGANADFVARVLRVFQQTMEQLERSAGETDTETLAARFAA